MAPRRRRPARLLTIIVLVIGALAGATGPAAAAVPAIRTTVVQTGLVNPWDIAFAPDGRMFVTERPGRIRVYASGAPRAALLRTFTIPSMRAEGESGALGLALDPAFASNGYLYVCASRTDGGAWRNQVLRYRVTSGSSFTFNRYVVRNGMRAAVVHNGCALEFGRDGKLYVSMGDAARSEDAQDPARLNGKILRLNGDGTIPADNPVLPGAGGPTAVFSLGHRNPQGIAIHPVNGRKYAAEHGPDEEDELNLLIGGGNYGWPIHRGPAAQAGFRDPCWSSGRPTIATSGTAFTRTANWGDFRNQLFVTTLKDQDIRRFTIAADGRTCTERAVLLNGTFGRLRAIVSGPSGYLFVSTSNGSGDRILRLVPVLP